MKPSIYEKFIGKIRCTCTNNMLKYGFKYLYEAFQFNAMNAIYIYKLYIMN